MWDGRTGLLKRILKAVLFHNLFSSPALAASTDSLKSALKFLALCVVQN